jgi:hypothetical protein
MCGRISGGTFEAGKHLLQFIFAVLLLSLGVMVAVQGVQKLTQKERA